MCDKKQTWCTKAFSLHRQISESCIKIKTVKLLSASGGRSIQIFYLSKSSDTTVLKYSVTSRSPSKSKVQKYQYQNQNIVQVLKEALIMQIVPFQNNI